MMARASAFVLSVVLLSTFVTCVAGQMRPTLSARIVRTKQGSIKGVLVIPSNRELQPVEAFLGVPYASPPVGALRFMPPVSPLPWNGVRFMDKYAPACPQTLPDVSNEREALRFVTRGRLQYLRRLLPYLRNQSEDCLYLNIYAPVTGGRDVNIKFPVIVFIHGESYEWNSGNPYDGSILASYGDVVVVTLNFRLGVLGFLRPDLRENREANFGLLDQIAALQWIQENIGQFGGDRDSVTLLGHGTGAACVNLLLISPSAQASSGLFHRAILMSGTALADWAIVENPLRYTLQAAQQVDCPLAERDDELASCLRFKRITELMSVRLQAPLYASPLAPLVDGIVVPNEPRQSMKTYNELFGRYDVMYGITQSESFHLLNAATLQFGLTETERNRIIRTYVRNSYASNIDQVTAAILNEYTDWKSPVRDTEEYRDSILEILSDARVVAPVIQMADLHSAIRQRSYFYVFSHQTTNGDYPQNWGSIHGEELAYVFGMPLVGGTNHLTANYTRAEMLLSEMVITYWSNFARTGNPNFPPRQKFLTLNNRDRFEPSYVQWPAYDRHSQKYLNIDLRPKVKDHYRADKMALWSKLIPELLSNGNGKPVSSSVNEEEDGGDVTTGGGFRSVLPLSAISATVTKSNASLTADSSSRESESNSNPSLMGAQPEVDQTSGGFQIFPHGATVAGGNSTNPRSEDDVHNSGGIALSIVIVIGICFLVLNVCACAGVFYQRDRVRFKEMLLQRQYKLRPANRDGRRPLSADGAQPMDGAARQSLVSHAIDDEIDGSGIGLRRNVLPHQASTSTMDPHTKVSQWMAQEVSVERCPTPPINNSQQQRNRLNKPALAKLGGSDRYDPRFCDADDPAATLFPQLTKSNKASDIYGLVPVKEENAAEPRPQHVQGSVQSASPAATVMGSTAAPGHHVIGQNSDGPGLMMMDSASTPSRTSTGRRKARTKSQSSLHKSITKRDVAVGDDDDDGIDYKVYINNDEPAALADVSENEQRSSAYGYGAMDTIRRLNLPKVLPDLPHQDMGATPTTATAAIVLARPSPPNNSSVPICTPAYARLPLTYSGSSEQVTQPGSRYRRQSVESPANCAGGSSPRASFQPVSPSGHYCLGKAIQPFRSESIHSNEDSVPSDAPPPTVLVKSTLAQPLVLAPHPRTTGPLSSTATRSPTSCSSSPYTTPTLLPEAESPCVLVRFGPQELHQTAAPSLETSSERGSVSATSDSPLPATATTGGDVASRRQKQQGVMASPNCSSPSAISNPSNRNSRSWYAQYSQSVISQSIDQESDVNET